MSTTVKYKGYTIATVENTTKTLTTQGKYLEGNITFTDVSSGGGGGGGSESNYTLVGSAEFTVSSTATSASSIGTVPCFQNLKDTKCIIYVRVRDKAGKRDGYFYGSDCFFLNTNAANNNTTAQMNAAKYIHRYNSGWNAYSCGSTTGYGVYAYSINSDGNAVNVYRRYNSTYSTKIDGTYTVEVYKLTFPDGVSPFDA